MVVARGFKPNEDRRLNRVELVARRYKVWQAVSDSPSLSASGRWLHQHFMYQFRHINRHEGASPERRLNSQSSDALLLE